MATEDVTGKLLEDVSNGEVKKLNAYLLGLLEREYEGHFRRVRIRARLGKPPIVLETSMWSPVELVIDEPWCVCYVFVSPEGTHVQGAVYSYRNDRFGVIRESLKASLDSRSLVDLKYITSKRRDHFIFIHDISD